MSNNLKGKRVRVVTEGTVIQSWPNGTIHLRTGDKDSGIYRSLIVYSNMGTVEVLPDPDPENWPPQCGDTWRSNADGSLYCVRKYTHLRGEEVVISSFDNQEDSYYKTNWEYFKIRDPELLFRPDSDSKPSQETSEG
jgi:hypothetical protein